MEQNISFTAIFRLKRLKPFPLNTIFGGMDRHSKSREPGFTANPIQTEQSLLIGSETSVGMRLRKQ